MIIGIGIGRSLTAASPKIGRVIEALVLVALGLLRVLIIASVGL